MKHDWEDYGGEDLLTKAARRLGLKRRPAESVVAFRKRVIDQAGILLRQRRDEYEY